VCQNEDIPDKVILECRSMCKYKVSKEIRKCKSEWAYDSQFETFGHICSYIKWGNVCLNQNDLKCEFLQYFCWSEIQWNFCSVCSGVFKKLKSVHYHLDLESMFGACMTKWTSWLFLDNFMPHISGVFQH